jgi:hypothetical protein
VKRRSIVFFTLVWASAWAWFVWPTPWRHEIEMWESPIEQPDGTYEKVPVQVRIHRISGEKQSRSGDEWGHFVW